ncbi:MAG: translocation/assembly module TamB domain-containing protein [Ferruginibacter sp.]
MYDATDSEKFRVDLDLKQFIGTRAALLALLPRNTIPDSILHYIPQSFALSGTYRGTVDDFFADLKLNSSLGSIAIKGTAKNITDSKNAVYDLNLSAAGLRVGQLLQDSTMDRFTGNVMIKGRGFDPAVADMHYKANIREFDYNRYKYNSIVAEGTMRKNMIEAAINSSDPNVLLTSNTTIDLSNRKKIVTSANIENADLQKLGFSKGIFSIRSNIQSDLLLKEDGKLNGNLLITCSDLFVDKDRVLLDTLEMLATDAAGIQTILLNTPFANASLIGNYTLQNLGPAFTTIANKYYKQNSPDTLFSERAEATLLLNVHTPSKLYSFVPGLTNITPFQLSGNINTDSSLVLLNTNIERIQYQDYIIDSFRIAATNSVDDNRIDYKIDFANLNSTSFSIPGFNLQGYLEQGKVDGRIELLDNKKELRYRIPFNLATTTNIPELHFDESILLNNKTWTANPANVIYLDATNLKGSKLSISNGNEQFSIDANTIHPSGLPLVVRFDNFNIRNITDAFLPKDSTLFEGIIDGNVTLQSIDNLLFTSDIRIDSLKLAGVKSGNLTVKADQLTQDIININAALEGNGNDLSLTGTYNSQTSAPDLLLDVKKFNLANANIATKSMLDNLRGNMSGRLTVKGTTDAPEINGTLQLDSLKTVYRAYNTFIHLPNGQIVFDQGNIRLNNMNILDSMGHKASVTGGLFTKDFKDIDLNVRFRSNEFQAIGPKIYPEQLIYGPAGVNSNLTITGDMQTMYVKGNVTLAENSAFTYVNVPQDNIIQGEGLIEFFDPNNPDTTVVAAPVSIPPAMNIGMALDVKLTPTSTITIMMDQASGDHLRIKGTADLNVTQEPGGDMYLAGKYVIDEGGYKLSLLGISRKEFSIQKGSTITWAGDPMKGMMDITAVYQARTSAGELVQDVDQTSGIGKQRMDFQVYLTLKDELLKPQIGFKLDIVERDRQLFNGIVYSRIKQINTIPAELNKQVIGLLALNRFIADNPFSSLNNGGGNFETNLYNTAGQYLTRELSDILSNAIKGFDIDLGLDIRDNYINGAAQRNTNFNVGITKKLANDRLSVYVGSSFALEGQNQDYSAASGLAGNVILEYLLTKDGKYRIKGFRTTENETILQGSIIKTGISFVMVFEFNRITQLFKPKAFYRGQQQN